MKKILIIPQQFYPIPAVKGGAVETLLTNLIDCNEIYHRAYLYIVSKHDEEASKHKYQYTKIIYVKNTFVKKFFFKICLFFRKLIHKVTRMFFSKGHKFNERKC